jgi:hypothetical protein
MKSIKPTPRTTRTMGSTNSASGFRRFFVEARWTRFAVALGGLELSIKSCKRVSVGRGAYNHVRMEKF